MVLSKEIPLTQGYVAIVDSEDYEYLSQWKWCARKIPKQTNYQGDVYVQAVRMEPGKPRQIMVYMHRHVMGLVKGDRKVVDHLNHNPLDNRKCNLRVTTSKENRRRSRKPSTNTSGYKGVHWHIKNNHWAATIKVDGKSIHLGVYSTAKEAALAYDVAAKKCFGDSALLNFTYTTVYGIQCPRCYDQVWSRHRHDLRYCTCRYAYVDGGRDYTRVGWGGEDSGELYGPPIGIEIEVPDVRE